MPGFTCFNAPMSRKKPEYASLDRLHYPKALPTHGPVRPCWVDIRMYGHGSKAREVWEAVKKALEV